MTPKKVRKVAADQHPCPRPFRFPYPLNHHLSHKDRGIVFRGRSGRCPDRNEAHPKTPSVTERRNALPRELSEKTSAGFSGRAKSWFGSQCSAMK